MNTTDKPKQPAHPACTPNPPSEGLLDRLFAWLDMSLGAHRQRGELARECHTAVWEVTFEEARGMSRDEARGYIRAYAPEFLLKEVDLVLQRRRVARVAAAADPGRGHRSTRGTGRQRCLPDQIAAVDRPGRVEPAPCDGRRTARSGFMCAGVSTARVQVQGRGRLHYNFGNRQSSDFAVHLFTCVAKGPLSPRAIPDILRVLEKAGLDAAEFRRFPVWSGILTNPSGAASSAKQAVLAIAPVPRIDRKRRESGPLTAWIVNLPDDPHVLAQQKHSLDGSIPPADADPLGGCRPGHHHDGGRQRRRGDLDLRRNGGQDRLQPAMGVHHPRAHGLLRPGNDRAAGRGHQARARGGHFRRLRVLLGMVLHFRPGADQLADLDHGIHRHDAGHVALRHSPVADVRGRDDPDVRHRRHGKILDLREGHPVLLPVQPGLHSRGDLGHADGQRARGLDGRGTGVLPARIPRHGSHDGRGLDHADHGEYRHHDYPLADFLPAVGGGRQGHGRPRHPLRQDRHLRRARW